MENNEKKNRCKRFRVFNALFMLVIIATGFFLHQWAGELLEFTSGGAPPPSIRRFPFSLIRETSDILSADPWTEKARTLRPSEFAESVEAVDQHSTVYSADEFRDFYIDTAQEYVGIGVTISADTDSPPRVVRVFDRSPAAKAGIQAGDRILQVNEEDVSGFNLGEVVNRIRGPAGSKITLRIVREAAPKPIAFSMERKAVEIPTVDRIEVLPQGILYIRIAQFGKNTGKEFVSAIRVLEERSFQGIILDLRNNTGGVLHAALDVLDPFFERGEPLLSTRGERPIDNRSFHSMEPRYIPDIPVVVLVNPFSASAAEVVAGALKVSKKAKLVGEKTHGKGSIQSVYASGDGGGFKVTTGYCILPDNTSFHEIGIEPDIQVLHSQNENLAVYHKPADEPLLPFMEQPEHSAAALLRDRQLEEAVLYLLSQHDNAGQGTDASPSGS